MPNWTTRNIPDQARKLAVVTGSTGGTGFETALELARKGAEIVIAARNPDKGADAIRRIRRAVTGAGVRFEPLDLASQASVVAFADRMLAAGRPIDILVNNAGVMSLPTRQETVDGHEMQWATNYLGHFALTARLMPLLKSAPPRLEGARVVQLSSIAHRRGRIRFDDLDYRTGYKGWPVYAQSKLAMLMFGLELDRRSAANGWGLTSVVAHPGYARTDLIRNGPISGQPFAQAVMGWVFRPLIEPLFSHSAAAGALPILMAATEPSVKGGSYLGATRMMELKGPPGPARAEPQALDVASAARLFDETERLLGVRFE